MIHVNSSDLSPVASDPIDNLQTQMIALVRAFGLHQGDQTPCGKLVSVAEAHTLRELSRHEALAQHELATWLRLEKSTVSRLVVQLEQRGWLARVRSDADKRVLHLSLTPNGRQIAGELAAARRARFARLLAAIPSVQRDAVMQALTVLVEAIDASVS
jgi:DNA-binding MarR family transcriptional regulator